MTFHDAYMKGVQRALEYQRKQLVKYSDQNAHAQSFEALCRALRLLPRTVVPSKWDFSIHISQPTASVTAEQCGADYDWVVENCQSVTFAQNWEDEWELHGLLEATCGNSRAVVTVKVPAPDEAVTLMRMMGLITVSDVRTYGGELEFACRA